MQALIIPLDQVVEENANVLFFEKKPREVFFWPEITCQASDIG